MHGSIALREDYSAGDLRKLDAASRSGMDRLRAVRDQRYEGAYIFGAVCPARGVGAALVMPLANGAYETYDNIVPLAAKLGTISSASQTPSHPSPVGNGSSASSS